MKKNVAMALLGSTIAVVLVLGGSFFIARNKNKAVYNKYNIKEVKVAPDGWDDGIWLYEENTGVVYFKDQMNGAIIKLESADYEFYIYDKKNNEFIGYNR